MIGRTVSHYRILSTLGSGGMGVVYLAEDERLGRQVALKFLPVSWSQERTALERFRVEARAASSLSHPGICAIYDIGDDGETPFIVMEALRGETLRERIAKGPMKVGEVLDVGIQLADALDAAHAQGIVHRDVKPANIFLGDKNRVKVLDFGLAKLTASTATASSGADTTSPAATMRAPENQITMPGTALGTVSYMSPEQARGEDIDARTDLFSLGTVLYEMVTGRQAFGGSTTAVVYDQILNRTPRPIAHLNPLVPPRLETVIATALEKDRELRYQHASDMQAELKRIRRDMESLSFASSQAAVPQAAEPAPPSTVTSVQPAAPAYKWERAAVAVAILAAVAAGVWVWRSQESSVDRATVAEPEAAANAAASVPPPETPALPSVPPPPSTPTSQPAAVQAGPTPRVADAGPPPRADVGGSPRPVPPPRDVRAVPVDPAPSTSTNLPRSSPRGSEASTAQTPPPAPVTPPVAAPGPITLPPASPVVAEAAAPPPAASPAPAPTPPAPAVTAPPRAQAQAEPQAPAPQTPAPEPDEAAIRRIIRTYEQAIETKDIALYRSVRPGLRSAEETILRNSFQQVDSQQVDIRVESLVVTGRTATARIARTDTLVTGGRRRTQQSSQTLRFERTPAGWVFSE